jgi:hypothetical protein
VSRLDDTCQREDRKRELCRQQLQPQKQC